MLQTRSRATLDPARLESRSINGPIGPLRRSDAFKGNDAFGPRVGM